MERYEATKTAEEIAELYDAIYHLTKVVKDLTRVIQEHDKTMEDLVSKTAWLAANMEA
jgi:hypothetical protein